MAYCEVSHPNQRPLRTLRCFSLAAPVFCILMITGARAEQVLFDPAGFDVKEAILTDAQARVVSYGSTSALQVKTGHQQTWPGITLKAPPGGAWDLTSASELTVDLKNSGKGAVTISCRVDNAGADGTQHCVSGSLKLSPGQSGTLKVALKRENDDQMGAKLFGMRGYPVKAGGPGTIDPAHIIQLLLFTSKPSTDQEFEVQRVQAMGRYTAPTASTGDADPFFPFINTFGQYRHKDWPGKAKSVSDLAAKREAEKAELAQQRGPRDWDKYGGRQNGPQLQATGFFRAQKEASKWWLVDPDGHLFFSHGIDCVRMLDTTPISERETWFENFPGQEAAFTEFLSRGCALKGHYAGRSPQCFSFAGANLARKYGPGWKNECPKVIHERLRSWGLNTIANWSDPGICLMRLTPYTDTIGSGGSKMVEGSEGYWGKFPDVFDPSFSESLRRGMSSKKGKSAGDPWCIGYFSDNEMSWGDELSLSIAALKSPPSQKAKQAFAEDLRKRYDTIEKLNNSWGTQYSSWDALLESRQAPDTEKARSDLEAFYTSMAEQYFRTVRDVIKEAAPHQLYLGCRFAWVNARAAAAAAKYCDVVSYNLYRRSVADFQFNGGRDVPLIIGEFHFGALDRGMFHTGLVPVADQQARAQAYRDYVQGALRHPQFVGCHWFQYQDEPVTGRVYDEENYQIGFIDVADTPYAETIQASRDVGYALYRGGAALSR
jgi:Beta-galactosidase